MRIRTLASVSALALLTAAQGLTAPPAGAESDASQCFKLQREIARAYNAYSLEARKPRRDVGTWRFFQALVQSGLLERVPLDPGYGGDSYGHFRSRRSGNGITCYQHGDPESASSTDKERCFAVQKQLADAIDSWTRDHGLPASRDIGTRRFFGRLVEAGLLAAIPRDPGQATDSFKNFRQSAAGAGIECVAHGPAVIAAGSEQELCWRLQAVIAAALDQHNLEKGVYRTDVGNRAFFHLLVREARLHEVPVDPGQGPDSYANFQYTEDGNHITCTVHGIPSAPAGNQTSLVTPED